MFGKFMGLGLGYAGLLLAIVGGIATGQVPQSNGVYVQALVAVVGLSYGFTAKLRLGAALFGPRVEGRSVVALIVVFLFLFVSVAGAYGVSPNELDAFFGLK